MEIARRLIEKYGAEGWSSVTSGLSGAAVYRLGKDRFLKVDGDSAWVVGEADRLRWLGEQGVPCPRIVECGQDLEGGWLMTEAVAGVPAAEWSPKDLDVVVRVFAETAAMLHAVPVAECPFRRDLEVTSELARRRVEGGLVDLGNLEDQYAGWTGWQLLSELERTRPADEDLVVCHGDLTAENILLDPSTGELAGLIDVDRLGVADRWLDLAVIHRGLSRDLLGPADTAAFLSQYGAELDPAKLAYYVLLDEFF